MATDVLFFFCRYEISIMMAIHDREAQVLHWGDCSDFHSLSNMLAYAYMICFHINLIITIHVIHIIVRSLIKYHDHETSNTSRMFVCNKIVDHSDVVGTSPVGTAPITSSFLT